MHVLGPLECSSCGSRSMTSITGLRPELNVSADSTYTGNYWGSYNSDVENVRSMIVVCWEVSRSMCTYDIVVVMGSVRPVKLVRRKYHIFCLVLQSPVFVKCWVFWVTAVRYRPRSDRLGGTYTVLIVTVSVLVGIFAAVNPSAVECSMFALLWSIDDSTPEAIPLCPSVQFIA
jgi:hypothetical protein